MSLPSGISKLKLFTAITSPPCFLSRLGKIFVRFFSTTFTRIRPSLSLVIKALSLYGTGGQKSTMAMGDNYAPQRLKNAGFRFFERAAACARRRSGSARRTKSAPSAHARRRIGAPGAACSPLPYRFFRLRERGPDARPVFPARRIISPAARRDRARISSAGSIFCTRASSAFPHRQAEPDAAISCGCSSPYNGSIRRF